MKIALLSGGKKGTHTTRWANGLASRGVEVHLICAQRLEYKLDPAVHLHLLPFASSAGYVLNAPSLIKLLNKINPDVLNAHYASGYGLLARLSFFRPTLLSVWGSDVYDFPEKSKFHRWLLRGNLKSASAVASTSHAMAKKVKETFCPDRVWITPFGVDIERFQPTSNPTERKKTSIVIGTVKTLGRKYGIDTLIEAFSIADKAIGDRYSLSLEITGGGPDLARLQDLAESLGIASKVIFHGAVSHSQVPEMLHRLDIYAALSRLDSESFGVAILEASACEKPVVVSDVDGPSEVMIDGKTALVVKRNSPKEAATALVKLVEDEGLRAKMGAAGREHVLKNYTWDKSLDTMLEIYESLLNENLSIDGAYRK